MEDVNMTNELRREKNHAERNRNLNTLASPTNSYSPPITNNVAVNRIKTENTFRQLKFGNLKFTRFVETLNISITSIISVDLEFSEPPQPFLDDTRIKYNSNGFELRINLNTSQFLDDDKIITATLKKLSKYSIKFDILLNKVQDAPFESGRFLEFSFKKRVKHKYPHTRKIQVRPETIRDIVGLKTHHDYFSITDKACNNGWQYIFHTADVGYMDIPYIAETLRNSKLSKIFYIKVFADKFEYLRIVIQDKKAFFKNGIPKITTRHVAAILGINEINMYDSYVQRHEGFIELHLTCDGFKSDSPFIHEILNNNFGRHYNIETIDNPDKKSFRFILKTESQTNSKEYVIRTILTEVKNQNMSVDQAEHILKSL